MSTGVHVVSTIPGILEQCERHVKGDLFRISLWYLQARISNDGDVGSRHGLGEKAINS